MTMHEDYIANKMEYADDFDPEAAEIDAEYQAEIDRDKFVWELRELLKKHHVVFFHKEGFPPTFEGENWDVECNPACDLETEYDFVNMD